MRSLREAGYTDESAVVVAGNREILVAMPAPVSAFYAAYLDGNLEGMLSQLAARVAVRFPSYPTLLGIDAARVFFAGQAGVLEDLRFELVDVITRGDVAAVVWRESATAPDGALWRAHGVDVIRHAHGLIASIEVGGAAAPLRERVPRFASARLATPFAR
ncbi:nuclear transport factor 2 family protein [Microbacterium trichothecenolyticum]|uniref:Nuclear transport factor 2 family protein n=1 Tax=Microbacterium ureisolvens TaxID=2781186 RepID=A0ABS7I0S9_9MICO|nr:MULTISPECIES: nuclear transport factor 2 family protein [Microbacterium]MBW9110450.1 nuclear transport factor 2 family protein [Microbacterium ureisolvens]MBW9120555.1 nuclear transport factor 2 family protein [Microbacterium trichothecenolyticum]